jgi:hypothetical protein
MQFICSFETTYSFGKTTYTFVKTVCSFKTAYKLHIIFHNKQHFSSRKHQHFIRKWSKDNPYMSMTPIYLDILCIQIKIKSLIAQ